MNSENFSFLAFAAAASKRFGPLGYWVPTWRLPDWVSHVGAALGDAGLKLMVPRLGHPVKTDNSKLKRVLGFGAFRGPEEGGMDMAESVIAMGAVPDRTRDQRYAPGKPAAQRWRALEVSDAELRGVRPGEAWPEQF